MRRGVNKEMFIVKECIVVMLIGDDRRGYSFGK